MNKVYLALYKGSGGSLYDRLTDWLIRKATKGKPYDWRGVFGIVLGIKQKRDKYFCSEWCFNLIKNSNEGWRFSPNQLAVIFKKG